MKIHHFPKFNYFSSKKTENQSRIFRKKTFLKIVSIKYNSRNPLNCKNSSYFHFLWSSPHLLNLFCGNIFVNFCFIKSIAYYQENHKACAALYQIFGNGSQSHCEAFLQNSPAEVVSNNHPHNTHNGTSQIPQTEKVFFCRCIMCDLAYQ